ncbi:hypothetical protein [Salisaeta longa]|uniref:hypothetical protein n=1 Tax=Salisaeta longa TaxID=503170 RepID=UPI0003B4D41C|nr:hypothetical protein [Salisaeta longa]
MRALLGILIAVGLLGAGQRVAAQRSAGRLGVGPQVGTPSGLSLKVYLPGHRALSVATTSDFDDYVEVHAYHAWERPLPQSPFWSFAGVGVITGGRRDPGRDPVLLSVGALAGINFFAERFEVFLQMTPAFRILPHREPRLTGSAGLRYYF